MPYIYSGTTQTKDKMQIKLATRRLSASKVDIHPEWKSVVPANRSGNCAIQKFSLTQEKADIHNLRLAIHGAGSDHFLHPGDYTRLLIDGETMMSDTQKEYLDHLPLFGMCAGHVLIMGLGLGCAASVIASNPDVTKITIVEISNDVIRLVGPTLWERFGDKIEIINADAFTWSPPKGDRYSAAWFDIWLHICDTNIPEMTKLKRRFARRCNWMGCWSEPEARRMQRIVKRMEKEGIPV